MAWALSFLGVCFAAGRFFGGNEPRQDVVALPIESNPHRHADSNRFRRTADDVRYEARAFLKCNQGDGIRDGQARMIRLSVYSECYDLTFSG
jgi:hypothetical protein